MQCTAKAKSTGTQCARAAIAGGTVCRVHGGAAPQVKAKAMQRLIDAAEDAAAELIRIIQNAESESVRVSAIKELFERAGIGEAQRVALEGEGLNITLNGIDLNKLQ